MATKKEKRLAALRKREEFETELAESNARWLKQSHEEREAQRLKAAKKTSARLAKEHGKA